jgi:hypothetical protein
METEGRHGGMLMRPRCIHIENGELDPWVIVTVKSARGYRGHTWDERLELCPLCLGKLIALARER